MEDKVEEIEDTVVEVIEAPFKIAEKVATDLWNKLFE